MPVLVIANWLGMPAEDREFIRTLSRQLLSLDQESPDRHTRVHEAITTLNDYVNPLVETRVSEPSDDLLSVLAIGEREGELSREEVLGNTLLLLIARTPNYDQPGGQWDDGVDAQSRPVEHAQGGRQPAGARPPRSCCAMIHR